MIRTEYTRQVPIKHWLPVVVDVWSVIFGKTIKHVSTEPMCTLETTGYKVQRAWIVDQTSDRGVFGRRGDIVYQDETDLLVRGEEVEGFEWRDEPIWEGK